MMAVSLIQPWATLWASGEKIHETRGWHPKAEPTELAVHASKKWSSDEKFMANYDPFANALRDKVGIGRSIGAPGSRAGEISRMTLGAIVGVVLIERYFRIEDYDFSSMLSLNEQAFGHWAPGRWAWKAHSAFMLPNPVNARGARGMWTVPPHVELQIREQIRGGKWVGHGH